MSLLANGLVTAANFSTGKKIDILTHFVFKIFKNFILKIRAGVSIYTTYLYNYRPRDPLHTHFLGCWAVYRPQSLRYRMNQVSGYEPVPST